MSLEDLRMLNVTSSQITIMQFYSNPRSIQASMPEKRDPYLARAEEQAVHRQL